MTDRALKLNIQDAGGTITTRDLAFVDPNDLMAEMKQSFEADKGMVEKANENGYMQKQYRFGFVNKNPVQVVSPYDAPMGKVRRGFMELMVQVRSGVFRMLVVVVPELRGGTFGPLG